MAARDWLTVYLKGGCMGAADAVPGVSGGTIALITGIYDRLVAAIAGLDPREALALLPLLALAVHDGEKRREAIEAFDRMDLPFLIVLVLGVLTAAITVANIIEFTLHTYPGPTYAFFFGLIAASAWVLRDEMRLDDARYAAVALLGFAVAFVVSGASRRALPEGPLVLFLVGAVAICAMILPGVSGSLILLVVGKYSDITGAVETLTDAAIAVNIDAAVEPFTTLAIFGLGALVGILSFARAVSWALEHYHEATLTFLVALMVGALRVPIDEVRASTPTWDLLTVAVLGGLAVVGAGLVVWLDHATGGIEY
ncbi:DUF368 domain-containing protein [Halospeciosus flavus]|uniref:DUF368 domain-containing protein n=1 Tax=Halospeciosus flavus TaxID=3032283 RepID=A0ABD5Z3K1_9EURY|nr:DUF368 domain-containing protein [Halospeciosus flavus]